MARKLTWENTAFVVKTVTFDLSVPPHVPSCEVPSSVFVGSDLELLCKDKLSIPPATYRWYKDNKALMASADAAFSIDTNKGILVRSKKLTILLVLIFNIFFTLFLLSHLFCVCLEQKFNSVSKIDTGMYRCESSNSAGAPKSCVAQQLKVVDCKCSC